VKRRPALAVHRTDVATPITPPPAGRGRLWYDFQIPEEFFAGLPGIGDKIGWVRRHLPRAKRMKIGGKSAWYERDILDFIESQRESERVKDAERRATA
jgi:hypothetical protein